MNKSIPCNFCNHAKGYHGVNDWDNRIEDCIECRMEMEIWGNSKVNIYHKYTPDNLKYLEQLSEEIH